MLPSLLTAFRDEIREFCSHYSEDAITDEQLDKVINEAFFKLPSTHAVHELETVYQFTVEKGKSIYRLAQMNYNEFGDPWKVIDKFYKFGPRVTLDGCPISYYVDKEKFLCKNCCRSQLYREKISKTIEGQFSITLKKPIQIGTVHIHLNKEGCKLEALKDVPVTNCKGTLSYENSCLVHNGAINYETGLLEFVDTDANDAEVIYWTTIPGKPNALLFYGDKFIFCPTPDKNYIIGITAYKYPTALFNDSSSPLLRDWKDFIVYEASRRIFIRRRNKEGRAEAEQLRQEAEYELLRKKVSHLQGGADLHHENCYQVNCGGCCGCMGGGPCG